jgi:hypothetical protein
MVETPPHQAERRCHRCDAVLYEGAEWCGMCFAPVTDTEEEEPTIAVAPAVPTDDEQAERATPTATVEPKTAMWPCPVCQSKNAIDLEICATCGTPFATLMREERARPKIEPSDAFRRSLLYPGLGHRMVGRAIDGFARGVLFGMLLLATLMLGLSGVSTGAVRFLFLTYAAATISVYLMTAFEARRLAEGGDLLVSSRALLWATVGILLLSIVMVALVIGTAARR